MQHDVTTWEIQEPAILKTGTGLSLKSICFEKTFQQWMAELKTKKENYFLIYYLIASYQVAYLVWMTSTWLPEQK